MNAVDHAYGHLVGTIVGVEKYVDEKRGSITPYNIVAATIITPVDGQDHNIVRVRLADGAVKEVRYMETRRYDFITHIV